MFTLTLKNTSVIVMLLIHKFIYILCSFVAIFVDNIANVGTVKYIGHRLTLNLTINNFGINW